MSTTGRKKRPALGNDIFYPEKNVLVRDAVSRLAVKIHDYHTIHGKKVVLVAGCGPEDGATKVAVNLAAALSGAGKKTLYVDADLRKGSKHDDGLCDYFRGDTDIDKIIRPSNLPDLDHAPSGKRIEVPALFLQSDKTSEFILRAKEKYDYIILDCPPVVCYPDTPALFALADGIVLVCSLNNTTKKQLNSAKTAVEPFADKYYGIVVNSVSVRQYRKHYALRSRSGV